MRRRVSFALDFSCGDGIEQRCSVAEAHVEVSAKCLASELRRVRRTRLYLVNLSRVGHLAALDKRPPTRSLLDSRTSAESNPSSCVERSS